MYYNLKQKCGKVVKNTDDLKEAIKEHPIIVELNNQIGEYDEKIAELQEKLKSDLLVYKKRVLQIKELMKTELTELEKNVLRLFLLDERKTQLKMNRMAEK
jgi:phage host-nuclease inhibitor protein Gam